MAFEEVLSLDPDTVIAVGGVNRKTGKKNPDSIEGYYIGSRKVTGKNGESFIHVFRTRKGEVGAWGKVGMDNRILAIPKGTMARVTYTGTKELSNGGEMYTYAVAVDKTLTIEVANIDYNEDSSQESVSYETDDSELDDDSQTELLARAERKAQTEALLRGEKIVKGTKN